MLIFQATLVVMAALTGTANIAITKHSTKDALQDIQPNGCPFYKHMQIRYVLRIPVTGQLAREGCIWEATDLAADLGSWIVHMRPTTPTWILLQL